MRLYIVGPMVGIADYNYPAFFTAEQEIIALGHQVFNPAGDLAAFLLETKDNEKERMIKPWEYYVRRDVAQVALADGIVLLPGWQYSRGTNLLVEFATELGLPLYILRYGELTPRLTIVGISGYARSGKDTLGGALVEQGFIRAAFADTIRASLLALNPLVIETFRVKDLVDQLGWDKAKNQYPEMRALLQRMGKEVGRDIAGNNFWLDLTFRNLPDGAKVVITDCRYINEAETIKRLGGEMWRVYRPGVKAVNNHPGEIALDNFRFDKEFINDGSVKDLYDSVKEIYAE